MTKSRRFRRVLLDTGPLVAILDLREADHRRCVELLGQIEAPLLTSLAVLTEAAWLLRHDSAAIQALLQGAGQGTYSILPIDDRDMAAIDRLHAKYLDLAPQLADLTLIHLAARERLDTVFTLDQRDFRVLRPVSQRALRILPDDA